MSVVAVRPRSPRPQRQTLAGTTTRVKAARLDWVLMLAGGSWHVFGAMLESHLVEGRQDYKPGVAAVYGQSITDACISWEQTEPLLGQLAKARRTRGTRAA